MRMVPKEGTDGIWIQMLCFVVLGILKQHLWSRWLVVNHGRLLVFSLCSVIRCERMLECRHGVVTTAQADVLLQTGCMAHFCRVVLW